MKRLGLYIHIPFCQKKCNYCDFYSLTCINRLSEYICAISKQIENDSPLYKDYEFDTVFIGGGTPSLVLPKDFNSLVNSIKNNLNLTPGCEFSLEANPGTLTKEKLIAYKNAGVNRLSMGLQSTNENELKMLGRIHTLDDFEKSFRLARECGFDNISVDLMYSLPNQTKKDFIKSLKDVISYNPEHISSYLLKIEKNTYFGKIENSLSLPDDDEQYNTYILMCELLEKNGYMQYEISNFAKKGYESNHNKRYWLSEEYIGIGPSAHSYFNGKRYSYKSNLEEYLSELSQAGTVKKIYEAENDEFEAQITKSDEYLMLKLRLSDGINQNEYFSRFGEELLEKYPKLKSYVSLGYMKLKDNSYSFTTKGFFVSNYILTDILSFGQNS